MTRGVKGKGDPTPYSSWRTRLIIWFMTKAPGSRHPFVRPAWIVHGDGCVDMVNCLPTGEIVSTFSFGSHVFDQFIENLLDVQAQKKLVDGT